MEMSLYLDVGIMLVASFILSYYLNEIISLHRNVTNNKHKLYMSLFMAFEMGIISAAMYYFYTRKMNIYLLIFLIIGVIYSGYKLRTLNFLNDNQYLLSMIEHHQNAIEMSVAHNKYYPSKNPVLQNLINNIIVEQEKEIDLMYKLLQNQP